MKLLTDYHVHIKNSSLKKLKSTIEEIARTANARGLDSVGVVFHGLNHVFGYNKQNLFECRKFIDEINKTMGINMLLGIEADVLSEDGTLDVDEESLSVVDLLLIGYHKMIKTDFASFFGGQKDTHEAVAAATDAYCNAILKYDVDIVAHPNSGIKLDLYRLAKTCESYNVMVELNNRHLNFGQDDVADLLRTGCHFVVSSDAYDIDGIGRVDNALRFVDKYNIPIDRIVNIEIENKGFSMLDYDIIEDKKRLDSFQRKMADNSLLSNEIENKLRDIAKDKGIEMKEYTEADYFKATLTEEERAVVEKAEAYLRKHGRLK